MITSYYPMPHLYKEGEVLVLNTENKTLPFPNEYLFQDVSVTSYDPKAVMQPHNFLYYFNAILMTQKGIAFSQPEDDITSSNKKVDYSKVKLMVVDSLSAVFELMLSYHKKIFTGKDLRQIYGNYQEEVINFFKKSNVFPIPKVYISLPQEIQDENGLIERRAFVHGQALAGKIEREFAVVLSSNPDRYTTKSQERYRFQTNMLNGYSAKTPMGMFSDEELFIPNDLNLVISRIYQHFKKDLNSPFRFPDILVIGASGTGKSTSLYNLIEG